jgi:hypothetical protein
VPIFIENGSGGVPHFDIVAAAGSYIEFLQLGKHMMDLLYPWRQSFEAMLQ